MANLIQNMVGMGNMTDQVIASDLFMASKTAIKSYAAALAETTTPEVTNTLKRQFDDAVNTHERVTAYMIKNGFYHPEDPQEQIRMNVQASDIVMNLGQ